MFSGRAFTSEKDAEELATLKEKMEELQLKLREKDELLKSAENLRDQMNAASAKLDEMKHQVSEKDGSLKYTQQQLSDAKVLISLCFFINNLAQGVANSFTVKHGPSLRIGDTLKLFRLVHILHTPIEHGMHGL
jgi:Tfp pilus assembly protein PilO